ncbi:MAG: acyltransferase family protein [Mycobacterium sp.]|nr:acyltransferase family protein [Mycobacterium sp.]
MARDSGTNSGGDSSANSQAKIIPLHGNSARAAQRATTPRQHPSAPRSTGAAAPKVSGKPTGRASRTAYQADNEAVEAVIHEFDRGLGQSAAGDLAQRIAGLADFVRKRLSGDYRVDEFGFDPEYNDAVVLPVLRFFYDKWFRVEVSGIENLPDTGSGLIVANHAGTLPFDGPMLSVAVHDHHPRRRDVRLLVADLAFDMPVLGPIARKAGHTMACNTDANRLLAGGELAAVFPEGYKGLGKHFRDRYKLQRFGRGGFVAAALRNKAPIIPCSIVGSEEIYPMMADVKLLARVLGVPYFPITPLFPLAGPLGLVPLPSKWHIAFGAPIDTAHFDEGAADDPMVTFELTDQVRETIQQTLFQLLSQRGNAFLG